MLISYGVGPMCQPGTPLEHVGAALNSRKYGPSVGTHISVQSCDYVECALGSPVILDLGTNDNVLDSFMCLCVCMYLLY